MKRGNHRSQTIDTIALLIFKGGPSWEFLETSFERLRGRQTDVGDLLARGEIETLVEAVRYLVLA